MGCKVCGVAGDLVAIARSWNPNESITVYSRDSLEAGTINARDAVRSVAAVLHGSCPEGSKCVCGHLIDFEGKSVQR